MTTDNRTPAEETAGREMYSDREEVGALVLHVEYPEGKGEQIPPPVIDVSFHPDTREQLDELVGVLGGPTEVTVKSEWFERRGDSVTVAVHGPGEYMTELARKKIAELRDRAKDAKGGEG